MNEDFPKMELLFGLLNASAEKTPRTGNASRPQADLLRTNRLVGRGEFGSAVSFHRSFPKDSPLFLAAAGVTLIDAIGQGNVQLFDQVLDEVKTYPRRVPTETARLATELFDVWLKQLLMVREECPQWLNECDLREIPSTWHSWALSLATVRLVERGEFIAARTLSSLLLSHVASAIAFGSAMDVNLKLILADTYRDEGKTTVAANWYRKAVLSARVHGYVLPFLTQPMGPKSALGLAIQELAPEFLPVIRQRAPDFFRNLIRFHNRLTGGSMTDLLTPREFYVATALTKGFKYKEIAERLGIAYCRVNDLITTIHDKLNIHGSSELKSFV